MIYQFAADMAHTDPTTGYVTMAIVVAGWTGFYILSCRFWPFVKCGRCKGAGKKFGPGQNSKTFRLCGRCKGSGRRLRFGRWAWNFIQGRRKKAA